MSPGTWRKRADHCVVTTARRNMPTFYPPDNFIKVMISFEIDCFMHSHRSDQF